MRPPKTSAYHSYEALTSFVGPLDSKRRVSNWLYLQHVQQSTPLRDACYLSYRNQPVMVFTEDSVDVLMSNYYVRRNTEVMVNSILSQFGWNIGIVEYGIMRKSIALKSLKYTPGSPEADINAYINWGVSPATPLGARGRKGIGEYTLTWTGRPIGARQLSKSVREKQLQQNVRRSEAAKSFRAYARLLGFPNPAKTGGFAWPKDKDWNIAIRMNAVARAQGYRHVADAWAKGFAITSDPEEIQMILAGMGELWRDANLPTKKPPLRDDVWIRYEPRPEETGAHLDVDDLLF